MKITDVINMTGSEIGRKLDILVKDARHSEDQNETEAIYLMLGVGLRVMMALESIAATMDHGVTAKLRGEL